MSRSDWCAILCAAAVFSHCSAARAFCQSPPVARVQVPACDEAKRERAEAQSNHLDTWNAVHTFCRTYAKCGYDADVAEGLSESIARLLTERWDKLPEAAHLMNLDPAFRTSVLAGVNATQSPKDLDLIRKRSLTACPVGLSRLCGDLRLRAVSALNEVGLP